MAADSNVHRNDYAKRLWLAVRKGRGNDELVDRLLISALIELRAYERFELLAKYCQGSDSTLHRFYQRLGTSELGHYQVFLRLASLAVNEDEVHTRWRDMLEIEAAAMAVQPTGPQSIAVAARPALSGSSTGKKRSTRNETRTRRRSE